MATAPAFLEDPENAQILYDRILQTSNRFLHNCKHFSVEILTREDPSYAEVARLMKQIAGFIMALADDFDPMMGQKAVEYCELMTHMGVAIGRCDQVALEELVAQLERKSGL